MVLISTIILARLLGKDDFGVAAYAISLIAIFSTLPAMGLGPAMIVHGRNDEENKHHKAHFLKMFVYLRTKNPHR